MATFPSDSVRTKNWGTETLTDSDQEAQFDLIHNYIKAALDSATGHNHAGTSNQGPKIPANTLTIASQAAADLLVAASSSAWKRLAKGTASQVLKMNSGATDIEWGSVNEDQTVAGSVVQVVNVQSGALVTLNAALPCDDTIPQNTEGVECMTLAITPKSATNKLRIDVIAHVNGSSYHHGAALFQDTTAGALACAINDLGANANSIESVCFTHYMAAGTTSETTFKVRCGDTAGVGFFNGKTTRFGGGVMASSITITEVKV